MTENLLAKTKIVIKSMKLISSEFTTLHEQRLLQKIRKLIVNINSACPMFKKQAPIVTWDTVKKISKALWVDTSVYRGSNISIIRKRKAAATAMVLAAKSGGRWKDVHRIRWEDIDFSSSNGIRFVQARLRLSKNNLINDFPQSLTWATTPTTPSTECPRAILKRWWRWCGCPKKGFVFSLKNKSQINGDHTIYQVKTKAKKLGLSHDTIPTKHSFRVSMCLTLKSMGVPADTINRFMNWRSESMQNYYLNLRNMRQLDAPAHKLAKLNQSEFALLQSNLF